MLFHVVDVPRNSVPGCLVKVKYPRNEVLGCLKNVNVPRNSVPGCLVNVKHRGTEFRGTLKRHVYAAQKHSRLWVKASVHSSI